MWEWRSSTPGRDRDQGAPATARGRRPPRPRSRAGDLAERAGTPADRPRGRADGSPKSPGSEAPGFSRGFSPEKPCTSKPCSGTICFGSPGYQDTPGSFLYRVVCGWATKNVRPVKQPTFQARHAAKHLELRPGRKSWVTVMSWRPKCRNRGRCRKTNHLQVQAQAPGFSRGVHDTSPRGLAQRRSS